MTLVTSRSCGPRDFLNDKTERILTRTEKKTFIRKVVERHFLEYNHLRYDRDILKGHRRQDV